VQTVMLMSQCCSDTCAAAMYDDRGPAPSGHTCGFFAIRREIQAYGCYPEGRERARLGYAFRCIDALRQHPTTAAAHREVLVTNDSPDVPVRTSDLSRERLVSQEAAARGLANKLGILNIPIERDMAKPEVEQGRTSHGKQCTFWQAGKLGVRLEYRLNTPSYSTFPLCVDLQTVPISPGGCCLRVSLYV